MIEQHELRIYDFPGGGCGVSSTDGISAEIRASYSLLYGVVIGFLFQI